MGFVSDIVARGYGGYRGWGDAAAEADFKATGGNGKWDPSASANQMGSSQGGDYAEMDKSINSYIDELIGQAQGDYNFAAKWIESNYAKALGTDNTAQAQFLKKVANELEKKIGTIAFDYETNTYRTISDRDLALKRLDYDEQIVKRQSQQEREAQGTNLNARGILSSTRENALGLAGKEVNNLENNITDRMDALKRSRENINISSDRSLADITTSARRAADSEVTNKTYQTDLANRQLDKQKKLYEAQRSTMKAASTPVLYNLNYG